jgi:hypothetical protein
MEKVTVLFLAANPQGTNHLSLDEEIRSITEKIRASDRRDALDLISAWAVRPDDLLQKLNEHKPQIVHFSGHGSQVGEIILLDSNGLPKSVGSAALEALFRVLKDNIQVVILNACYSRIQAEAIAKVVDCVIGMKAAIGDKAAITFAASFYRAIGFGRSVQEAFEQGKVALLLEGIPEEGIPELLCRSGVAASKVILCKTQTQKSDIVSPSYNTVQTMTNSPGGIQVGRDLNVNTARRVTQDAANLMVNGLKNKPCQVTVGALGLGGEPDRLADELLQIAQYAGCQTSGVNHGVGFPTFYGVQVLYSPVNTPVESIQIITAALKASKIDYVEFPDPNQKPGSVYLYVGYKPL